MRSKRAFQNTAAAILYEAVVLVCGLILPRLILSRFGSSYNGITSSIAQFLSVIALLRSGMGGVTIAALYGPLASKDNYQINEIVNATEHFMRKVALIYLCIVTFFAATYPLFINSEFDWKFSSSLVFILGISTFMEYYFGLTYTMLLQAAQKQFVLSLIRILTTILNVIAASALIYAGAGIHLVKLGSAAVFCLNPILVMLYAKKNFAINKKVPPKYSLIKQRWDAFGQQVANFIHNNTDIMVLTIFTTLKEVSVYTVYYYVIRNIRQVLITFTSGFGAAFGDMLAKNETELLKRNLKVYELIIFSLTTIIYSVAGIMIVPFVIIYTKGVTDVNYIRPLFAVLLTLAGALSCVRIPYQTITESAGHFKQTRNGCFVEAGLNIVLSLIFVGKFGIVGVVIGTVAATIFRSCQYALYVSKNIIKRSMWNFFGHMLVGTSIVLCTIFVNSLIFRIPVNGIKQWIFEAGCSTLLAVLFTSTANLLFYKKDTMIFINQVKGIIFKRKNGNKNESK